MQGPTEHTPRRRRPVWPWVTALVLLLAAGTAGAVMLMRDDPGAAASNQLTFEVARGPMVVSVTESGTIQAAEQEILRSELEGRSTIIYLIPEGRQVEKGELLVELDSSTLITERREDEIEVMNAEAASIQAQENLAVVKNQAEADLSVAELELEFAKQDLEKYVEGEYPKLLMEAENEILIAGEELERAQEKFAGSETLFQQQFVSQSELRADELAMNKAKLNLEMANEAYKLLEQYDKKRQVAQLESDLEQAEMALERAKRKASADVVQAEAELRANESELAQEKESLQRVIDQINKAKIYAPRAGLVVYATSVGDGGWRGNNEPLEEGQEIRERQELIYLPTANDMIAEISIHESSLEKVRLGMPVRITVDALPGKQYWGEVTRIAPLPDASSRWMNPDLKVYKTQIKIHYSGEDLRTGMSCRAEVIVETYEDTVYVPVQSIVRISGVPTAFVVQPDGSLEQREVELGQNNNRMVVIQSGLEKGEQVLLNPPLGDSATVETLRSEDIPDEQKQKATEAKDNPGVKPVDDSELPPVPAGPGGEGGPDAMGAPGGQNGNDGDADGAQRDARPDEAADGEQDGAQDAGPGGREGATGRGEGRGQGRGDRADDQQAPESVEGQ